MYVAMSRLDFSIDKGGMFDKVFSNKQAQGPSDNLQQEWNVGVNLEQKPKELHPTPLAIHESYSALASSKSSSSKRMKGHHVLTLSVKAKLRQRGLFLVTSLGSVIELKLAPRFTFIAFFHTRHVCLIAYIPILVCPWLCLSHHELCVFIRIDRQLCKCCIIETVHFDRNGRSEKGYSEFHFIAVCL